MAGKAEIVAPPVEKLIALVKRYQSEAHVKADRWVRAESIAELAVGDVALVYSYNAWRRGIVAKVGRLNVSVSFTTEGALRDAQVATTALPGAIARLRAEIERSGLPAGEYTANELARYEADLQAGGYTPKVTTKTVPATEVYVLVSRAPEDESPSVAVGDIVTIHRGTRWHEVVGLLDEPEVGGPDQLVQVASIEPDNDQPARWVSRHMLHVVSRERVAVPAEPQVIADFVVLGTPRPKGSMKVISRRGARPVMTEDNPHSTPWRAHVAQTARIVTDLAHPAVVPVRLELCFQFDPPAVSSEEEPTGTDIGDLDKLERNILDALVDAGILADDRQVVEIDGRKIWAPGGDVASAHVRVLEVL